MSPRRRPTPRMLTTVGWSSLIALAVLVTLMVAAAVRFTTLL